MLIRALGLSLVQMVKMYSYTIHQLKLTVLRVLRKGKKLVTMLNKKIEDLKRLMLFHNNLSNIMKNCF